MFRDLNELFREMNDVLDGNYYIDGTLKRRLSDGTVEIYDNGRLHCDTGPAVIKPNGSKEYWLNGRQVSESDVIKQEEYRVLLTKKERELVERVLGRKLK